ncbi:MAG: hypothetical protein JSV30_06185 [Candidatus Omnitrophota bacterium]|nr:MAG: hypothetical protein JSV30_06185 [Candidatus Omnitrophota bacterium]
MQNPINYYNILLRLYIVRIIGRMNIRNKGQVLLRTGGQVLLEYGLILVLIATTIIGIQLYVRRGLQARLKDAVDGTIERIYITAKSKPKVELPTGEIPPIVIYSPADLQYEPYYEQSDITTTSNSNITNSYSPGGASSKAIESEKTMRTGSRLELPYSDKAGPPTSGEAGE